MRILRYRATRFKIILAVLMVILLTVALPIASHASLINAKGSFMLAEGDGGGSDGSGGGSAGSGNSESTDSGSDSGAAENVELSSGGGGGGEDNSGLVSAISSLVSSIKEFVENVKLILQGKLMDIVLEWLGKQFDSFFRQVNGLLGSAFMYTPPLHTKPWIHSGWSFVFWISLACLVLASVIAVGKVLHGNDKDGDPMEPLKILLPAFGLAIASFYLVDFGVYIANKISTSILQSTVNLAQGFGAQKINVGDPAAGDIIVKFMFTPDAAFGTVTGEESLLYKVMIKSGGMILLFIGYPLLFLIALVSLARYLLVVGLAIGSPMWHVGAALSGRTETFVGFWYQVGRLLGLEIVAGIAWAICARLQLAEIGKLQLGWFPQLQFTQEIVKADALGIGISATFATIIILLAYLVFSLVFVWKSYTTVLKDPVSLGGGGVMLGASKLVGKAALIGRGLSQRFDNPTWERRSMKLGETAQKAGDIGRKWVERSNSPLAKTVVNKLGTSGSADRATSPVEMPFPFEVDQTPVSAPNSSGRTVTWTSIRVPPAERPALLTGISSLPSSPVVNPHPHSSDRILVAPGHVDTVIRYLNNHYARRTLYWSDGRDYVTVEDGLPVVRQHPPAGGQYMGPWRR